LPSHIFCSHSKYFLDCLEIILLIQISLWDDGPPSNDAMQRIGIIFMALGCVLASEQYRKPQSLAGYASWLPLNVLVWLGYFLSDRLADNIAMTTPLVAVCCVAMVLGWMLRLWAVQTLGAAFNLWFSANGAQTAGRVVRHGPYAYIRHPGVANFLLTVPPAALLASASAMYGAAVFLLLALVYGFAVLHEEKQLLQQMPSFKAYKEEVKFRFVPFIF
jgi:protein-S-isoprenylcysteine O-methyltransferase Ste14